MEQAVQCPVCTLFLHNGMSLESHLDTHPKDQVIKALCSLSASKSNYSSRSSTPSLSEKSYRSRSRTPASEDNVQRWSGGIPDQSYWRRLPSRVPNRPPSRVHSQTPKPSNARIEPPDARIGELTFENLNKNLSPILFSGATSLKSDKPSIVAGPVSDCQPYSYVQDQKEDLEIKYSRSLEYNAPSNMANVFACSTPNPTIKLQPLSSTAKRNNDLVNINVVNNSNGYLNQQTDNLAILKTDLGSVQYISARGNTMQMVVPTSHNNLILQTNMSNCSQTVHKTVSSTILPLQFGHPTTSSMTPAKTVVAQNSQIIYREMVHSTEGKPFMPGTAESLPGPSQVGIVGGLPGHSQAATVGGLPGHSQVVTASGLPGHSQTAQYHNLMFVNPYRDQGLIGQVPKPVSATATYTNNQKPINEPNKTLVIEIGPRLQNTPVCTQNSVEISKVNDNIRDNRTKSPDVDIHNQNTMERGLKILSNIKVEVPVQHHHSMLGKVIDITDPDYVNYEYINPISREGMISTTNDKKLHHTFSVIKNVGNPPTYKDSYKPTVDNTADMESLDSCPVPDLICNEKPSISPCSELSENGDNATDNMSILSSKRAIDKKQETENLNSSNKDELPQKPYWNQSLGSKNVFTRKPKKILQIKNSKFPKTAPSCSRTPDHVVGEVKKKYSKTSSLNVSSNVSSLNIFDADTEEQSMDIEPMAHTSYNESSDVDMQQIKQEANNSDEMITPDVPNLPTKHMAPAETIRPININNYGNNFNSELDHRKFIELENVSKNKYVNMMNDNYFGDNIYADYFTPDREESFGETIRESANLEEGGQEENFIIPNYQPSYKEDGNCTNYTLTTEGMLEEVEFSDDNDCEGESAEQDSKLDVLSVSRSESGEVLDICANEKMPPRGELSGQESNGDMDAPWTGIYSEVTQPEPYDLIARESWISDSSDMDARDRHDFIDVEIALEKPILQYSCTHCDISFPTLKELNAHHTQHHSNTTKTASVHGQRANKLDKLPIARIKKEDNKNDIDILPEVSTDIKSDLKSQILFVDVKETKPNISDLIKKERRKRKDYICSTCKEDQKTEIGFQEHLRIHPLECLTCGKYFYRRANLNLHMRMHLGIRNFKCDVCEKPFATRQKLQEHQNGHTGRTPFQCNFCTKSFRRYSNMIQHRDRHHLKKKAKQRDLVCHCGAVFHTRAKLRWHAETHAPRPRACPYCRDRFVHAASLTRHIRRAHDAYYVRGATHPHLPNLVLNVPCPVCKQIYLRSTLKSHMATHAGKRPFLCHICNKSFTTNWNLKLHRWVHMSRSAKPYKCTLCKGAFFRLGEYNAHMNAHKSVKPYTCNYCGCQFIRKYNCQRHVKEHEMAKKFICKVPDCGKSFHRSYYLTEHMRVHSGARPFSCNICGKTSSNKSNHNKHVKVHHSRDPIPTEA